jgi:putative oxidoreductase
MKRLFSTGTTDTSFTIATLLLRLGFGSMMLVNHGYDKLVKFGERASTFQDPFGIGSTTSLSLIIFAEFFCAAFIILGLFTRLSALVLVIGIGVALFYRHDGQIFGDGELAGMYFVAFAGILLLGPGKVSIDRFIAR